MEIVLQIWDPVKSLKVFDGDYTFYPGASAVIIVFDLHNNTSLETLNGWFEEINKRNIKKLVSIVLIGNKSDLSIKINVHHVKVILKDWEKIFGIAIPFHKVSSIIAKDNLISGSTSIDEIFSEIGVAIAKKQIDRLRIMNSKGERIIFKIILVGDKNAGKSTLKHRYIGKKISGHWAVDLAAKRMELNDSIL